MSHAKSVLLGYSVLRSQRGAWVIIARTVRLSSQNAYWIRLNNLVNVRIRVHIFSKTIDTAV